MARSGRAGASETYRPTGQDAQAADHIVVVAPGVARLGREDVAGRRARVPRRSPASWLSGGGCLRGTCLPDCARREACRNRRSRRGGRRAYLVSSGVVCQFGSSVFSVISARARLATRPSLVSCDDTTTDDEQHDATTYGVIGVARSWTTTTTRARQDGNDDRAGGGEGWKQVVEEGEGPRPTTTCLTCERHHLHR